MPKKLNEWKKIDLVKFHIKRFVWIGKTTHGWTVNIYEHFYQDRSIKEQKELKKRNETKKREAHYAHQKTVSWVTPWRFLHWSLKDKKRFRLEK